MLNLFFLHLLFTQLPMALLLTTVGGDAKEVRFIRDISLTTQMASHPGSFRSGWPAIAGGLAKTTAEQAGTTESMMNMHKTLVFVTLGISGMLLLRRRMLPPWTGKSLVAWLLIVPVGVGTASTTSYHTMTSIRRSNESARMSLCHEINII